MKKHQVFLFLFFFIFSFNSYAQKIDWNQPEVVPEKLQRNNRRVLLFSGVTRQGTQIRIRDNKVKMIFSSSNVRWARIPQKHRVQFPVIANETGYFSFHLYLPTTAVEIPLEIFSKGKWIPYRFSFEVPTTGQAEDFKFIEESYKIRRDEENVKVEDILGDYDRQSDMGQVVNDRDEWKSWVTKKVIVWGGLGLSYYSFSEKPTPGDDLGTISGVGFPMFEIGGEYRWAADWKADLGYINRMADIDPDGGYSLQNTDFSWAEIRGNVTYYPDFGESETSRWGFLGGLRIHDFPFLKQVGASQYRVYSNSITFISAGISYETMRKQQWNYEASASLMYPVVVDDEFDVDSAIGFHAGFNMVKEIIPALYLGGKLDMNYIQMEATHKLVPIPTTTVNADVTAWHLTPSVLVKAEF